MNRNSISRISTAQQKASPIDDIAHEIESHVNELASFRDVLDRLAKPDDEAYGVFDGLSCWLGHIIDDIEGTKHRIPAAERATIKAA